MFVYFGKQITAVLKSAWRISAFFNRLYRPDPVSPGIKAVFDKFGSDLPEDEKTASQLFSDSLEQAGQFPDPADTMKEVSAVMADADIQIGFQGKNPINQNKN